jgi:hypothetical protein
MEPSAEADDDAPYYMLLLLLLLHGVPSGVMSFPVFQVGSRRTVQNWAPTEGDNAAGGINPLSPQVPWLAATTEHKKTRTFWNHQHQPGAPPASVSQPPVVAQHWLHKTVGPSGKNSSSEAAGLPAELATYSPDQVKLLCLSQVKDSVFRVAGYDAMMGLLSHQWTALEHLLHICCSTDQQPLTR